MQLVPRTKRIFMFSPEELKEFKDIYLKEFGEEIDDRTALELAQNLINLYGAVYGNHQEEKHG